jgi:hypothetical protein
MGPDDASSAEMRRLPLDPGTDPLALDDETVERLLAGELSPEQAPPGYAEVAELLAAATAAPTRGELAGQAAVLAELRAVTGARRAPTHARRAARPPRRRMGLAAAVLVGALAMGGVAAAATGHLPAPVREATRSILSNDDGAQPAAPTQPAPEQGLAPPSPASAATTAGPTGPRATGSTRPGFTPAGTGPLGEQERKGLCRVFLASQDKTNGKKMDAAAFARLARAAGGESRIPAYCEDRQPGGPAPRDQTEPPDNQGQGQSGPPPGPGGGQGQGEPPSTRSSSR